MIIIILVFLGLCAGSFIDALVWRLHKQSKAKKTNPAFSIVKGHSMCPSCRHRLHARDLIPVLSWLELRGRCRYCQAKIGWQTPAVEVLTASLFVLSYLQWPYSLSTAGWLVFVGWLASVVMMIALLVYDLRWMILPDRLVYPLIGVASLMVIVLALEAGSVGLIVGPVLGALFLSGLFWSLFQVSAGKWIGGGDVKLAVALGLLAGGLLESVLLLFIASLLGTVVSLPLLIKGKSVSAKVPFGPFLIAATFIVWLWGPAMINWYSAFIGV